MKIEHDVNIYSFDDYIFFFEDLFLDLQTKNLEYSQRDFANDLGVAAPRISQILKGKEGLSVKRARVIADKIDFNEAEKEYFLHLVLSKTAKSKGQKEISKDYIKKYNHSSSDQYLDMKKTPIINLPGFDIIWNFMEIEPRLDELKKICQDRGFNKEQFNELILTLIEEDLISIIGNRILRRKNNLAFGNSLSSKDIRNYHISKLEQSISSLKYLDKSERKNESMTFTIKKSDYTLLEKRVEEFIDNFRVGLTEGEHDEIMTINVSLFPSLIQKRVFQ